MPMVLQALYRVVSPWWLSLTLRIAVAEVALSVMPVAWPLRALLRFTASLMLLMLLVVGVGLCGRSVACVRGWAAFVPGRALAGSIASDRDGVQ